MQMKVLTDAGNIYSRANERATGRAYIMASCMARRAFNLLQKLAEELKQILTVVTIQTRVIVAR